jgi:hypothetical protein
MIFYLLCDECQAPSTRIVHIGYPGMEKALCNSCYEESAEPAAAIASAAVLAGSGRVAESND